MKLSDQFKNLVERQLGSFEEDGCLERIVVYVTQTREGEEPSLQVVGQWPVSSKALLPVEEDPDLRAPSPARR